MKNNKYQYIAFVGVQLMSVIASSTAFAHHPMGGAMPDSALEGLLSGLGHPIIEAGHLIFLLSAAIVAAICMATSLKAFALLASYVAFSSTGILIAMASESFTLVDFAVGLTLLAMSMCLWLRRSLSLRAGTAIAALAGVAHGMAYAEAVIGAEPTPVLTYLVGLTIIQTAIVVFTFVVFNWVMMASTAFARICANALAAAACVAGVSIAVLAV
jgi:urease accessory protein